MSLRAVARRVFDPVYRALQRLRGQMRRWWRARGVRRAAAAFAAGPVASSTNSLADSRPAAVLLLERLGDMVAASGIVQDLRARHPELRFAWFGRERYREVALLVPGIEEYIAVECYGELRDVVGGLAGWQIFDLNLNGKTCACCTEPWRNLSGSVGPDTEDYYDHGSLAQAFAKAGGVPWLDVAPRLDRPKSRSPLVPGRPYVVVHSESEESARNWSPEGFGELVATLLRESEFEVVHVGGRPATWLPNDPRVRDVAGRTGIVELIEVVQDAALFVGIDSSVAHIANAAAVPGLVLLGRYRRFLRYWPYQGFYGEAAGGALVVRYPSECPYLPVGIGVRALRAVLRRLRQVPAVGPPLVGRGGPWDVRAQEVLPAEAGPTLRQDSSCDVGVLAELGAREPLAALKLWPGSPNEVVLVLDSQAFAERAKRLTGVAAAITELEATGARFLFASRPEGGDADQQGDAVYDSPNYARLDGVAVVLDEVLPATACVLDTTTSPAEVDTPPPELSPSGASWWRWDVAGTDPATVQRLHERVVAARAEARAEVLPAAAIDRVSEGVRAGVDEVRRGATGAVESVSGWLVLESTGTPPAVLCLAERLADGRFQPRHLQPYSRLERPDVAHAVGSGGALFSGLRIDVPAELQPLGPELAVLVLDRAAGRWQSLRLPG